MNPASINVPVATNDRWENLDAANAVTAGAAGADTRAEAHDEARDDDPGQGRVDAVGGKIAAREAEDQRAGDQSDHEHEAPEPI